jgi:hypothetical protein
MGQHLDSKHPNWLNETDRAMTTLRDATDISIDEEAAIKIPKVNQGKYILATQQREIQRINQTGVRQDGSGDSPRGPRQSVPIHPQILRYRSPQHPHLLKTTITPFTIIQIPLYRNYIPYRIYAPFSC